MSDPGVIRIPGNEDVSTIAYRPLWARPYEPQWIQKAGGSQTYKPGEYDDPAYKGTYKKKLAQKDIKKGKMKNDIPDWANGYYNRSGEKGADFAKRLLDSKYGKGTTKKGPRQSLVKFKNTEINILKMSYILQTENLRSSKMMQKDIIKNYT